MNKTGFFLHIFRLIGFAPRRPPTESDTPSELREASHDLTNATVRMQGMANRLERETVELHDFARGVQARWP